MRFKREEWFTIPNILGYFRLILIPVFAYLYLHAETVQEFYYAAVAIGLSGLTDMFDGKIARKFNQVTELGKLLDPIADKLTQITVLMCVASRYPLMWLLVTIAFIKDGFMAVMGYLMLQHNGRKLNGAKWFGKVCTAVLYVVLFIVLAFPLLQKNIMDGIVIGCAVMMAGTFIGYIGVFQQMWKEPEIQSEG